MGFLGKEKAAYSAGGLWWGCLVKGSLPKHVPHYAHKPGLCSLARLWFALGQGFLEGLDRFQYLVDVAEHLDAAPFLTQHAIGAN